MLTRITETLGPTRFARGHRATPDGADGSSKPTRSVATDASTDPLATFISAWAEIVGAKVAAETRPKLIVRNALVIRVKSNVWAQQLQFSSLQIVARLAKYHPAGTIQRLAFDVGQLEPAAHIVVKRETLKPSDLIRQATVERPLEPPATAHEALERYRATVERVRRIWLSAGGHTCSRCGNLLSGGSLVCGLCSDDALRQRRNACALLIHQEPATPVGQALARVDGLTAAEFEAVRRDRLRAYWDEIVRARVLAEEEKPIDECRVVAAANAYVSLQTRISDLDRISGDSPIRRNVLGDLYNFVISLERYVTERPVSGRI